MKRIETNTTRTLLAICGIAGVMVVAAALSGCGENLRRNKKHAQNPQGVSSGLNALANGDGPVEPGEQPTDDPFAEKRGQVEDSARLLEKYFAQAERDAAANPTPDPVAEEPAKDPVTPVVREIEPAADQHQPVVLDTDGQGSSVRVSLADAAGDVDLGDDPADEGATESDDPPTDPQGTDEDHDEGIDIPVLEIDPETRKEQLVDELVGVLTQLAQSADDPGASALALAGLETLRPDTLNALVEQGLLSQAEQDSLQAVRTMLRSLAGGEDAGAAIASPAEVAGMLEKIQIDLNAKAGMQITGARLCTRVSGFGQFEPFPSNTFAAGRAHRAIVYVEVDRFTQRESVGNDGDPRFEVQLSQRLELYHIADDLNTWNRKAETDTTTSRNRLRDYYLINQIELPPTLGVGRYNLKVVVRDLISNQAVEAIIPLEIVAG